MKVLPWILIIVAVLVGGFFALDTLVFNGELSDEKILTSKYDEVRFTISGEPVELIDGYAEGDVAPGSASKTMTRYFGNEAEGDFSGDGIKDYVFLVTQEMGGSGTFFYLVGAVATSDGYYAGTQALMIGDRIAPQTTEFRDGLVIVNYAERAPGEPMTSQPSMGKSLYLKYSADTNDFGEVVQDFEGEANPASMTLGMNTWTWIQSKEGNAAVVPKQAGAFSLTFADGRFSATTDCNSMSGSYTWSGATIDFGAIASTKMYCEGSQESLFASILERTDSFQFTSKGELILNYAGNSATFR